MAAWIKIALGMEVGLGPGDFVLDGEPAAPLPKKGTEPSPNFRPMVVVAKRLGGSSSRWTWHGDGPRPRPYCARSGPSSPPQKGDRGSVFGPCLLWPNGWMYQDGNWCGGRPRPRQHCVRWAPPKGHAPRPNFRPIVTKRLDGSRCHLVRK